MGDDCVFCSIVDGDERAYRVYEDEQTLAFLDVNAIADGHTLVIPRRHHPHLTDMDDEETAAMFTTVRRVASAIESAIDPDGINVFQSNGRAAGQDVFHVHAHVVPRYADDGFGFAPSRYALEPDEGERIAGRLREEL